MTKEEMMKQMQDFLRHQLEVRAQKGKAQENEDPEDDGDWDDEEEDRDDDEDDWDEDDIGGNAIVLFAAPGRNADLMTEEAAMSRFPGFEDKQEYNCIALRTVAGVNSSRGQVS